MNEAIDELDTSWVETYVKKDSEKELMCITDIDTIKCFLIYIDNNNGIQDTKSFDFELDTTNLISKEEVIGLIKKYSINKNIRFGFNSIITYNVMLENDDIDDYVKISDDSYDKERFLKITSSINDINLKPCIQIFHDINSLFIVFKSQNSSHNITKKIYIKSSKSNFKKKQTRKRT